MHITWHACFTLEQTHERISCSRWTRIFLFNFCSTNFQTISYSLFLLSLKCFQTVFKAFLGCFIVWYEMFTTTLQKLWSQWADQSMTFFHFSSEESPASVVKVRAAFSNPQVFASLLYVIKKINVPCLSTSRYYHLVSWGIPFVVACLPLINDHYGPAGAWW